MVAYYYNVIITQHIITVIINNYYLVKHMTHNMENIMQLLGKC